MSFEDALDREELEEITVDQFFPEFQKTCTDEKKSFYFFKELLDCGVKLRRSKKGFSGADDGIHKSDIGVAISKAKRTLDIGAEIAVVSVRHKSGQLDHVKISELFIRKNEVMVTYSDWGESKFPWSNGIQLIDPNVIQKEEDAVYLTLFEAISKILNISKVSSTDVDAMNLISRIEKCRGSWDVRERGRGDESYVLLPDFIEWAWQNGYQIIEKVVEAQRDNLSDEFKDEYRVSLINQEIIRLKKKEYNDVSDEKWRDKKLSLLEKEKVKILNRSNVKDDKKEKIKPILERRSEILNKWLIDEDIPESSWLELDGYSREEIAKILYDRCPDVFSTEGARISKSTFRDNFWKKQRICKLKQRKLSNMGG